MAPKSSALSEVPPAESSEEDEAPGSEEDEEDSEKEGSASSEEEQPQNPKKKLQIQTAKAAAKKSNPATQEADSGSDSESDSDDGPISNVKPVASRPMEDTLKNTVVKHRSKPSASTVANGKLTAKRTNEVEGDAKETKRSKRDSGPNGVADKSTKTVRPKSKTSASTVSSGKLTAKVDNEVEGDAQETKRVKRDSESSEFADKSEDAKKQLFQRLWSEDDEITVLKGMIDFTEKKGIDPTKDMNSFFAFIKKSLHINFSVSQLKDKVSRLKKRYDNHSIKGKTGEDKTFSKPRDQKLFDLSKKVWGSEGISGASVKSAVSSGNNNNLRAKNLAALKAELGLDLEESEKVGKEEVKMETKLDRRVDFQGMQEYVIQRGLDTVEGLKKVKMQEKWRKLHVAELELFAKRNKLLVEQAELMLEGFRTMED